MRALITGSTGLLGGWLVREATLSFADVVAIGGPSAELGVDLADEAKADSRIARARASCTCPPISCSAATRRRIERPIPAR